MTTRVGFKDLEVKCIIGILPFERENLQTIFISAWLEYDASRAAATEEIEHAIDYAAIADEISKIAKREQFQLIETLTDYCLAYMKGMFPQANKIRFKVKKPAAVPSARYSFCEKEICRSASKSRKADA